MIVRHQPATTRRPAPTPRPTLRRRAMCQLIAVALFGGGAAHAATPPAFSPAWFASRQQAATVPAQGSGNNGNAVSFTPGSALLQQRVRQSITNLDNAAAALAAQMQQQKDAQAAAAQLVSTVPNGLGDGGLKPASGIATDPTLWQNANAPTDSVAGTKHTVEVKQTAQKAILTWDSFNIGRDTTLYFNQSAGNQSDGTNSWIALNRVNDPSAKPSQILGQMKAEGTVYLLNRNGVVFGAGSQVNTHSLIASSLSLFSDDLKTSNDTFMSSGIASALNRDVLRTFTTGAQDIVIEKGASITTGDQGFAIIAAPNVSNAGSVVADGGQAVLAASTWVKNVGTSTDLEWADGGSKTSGTLTNTGLVQARRGSVTLLGHDVTQAGVVVVSTSIAQPGSIHVMAEVGAAQGAGDPPLGAGTLRLASGSVTAVLPEKDGATTTSSASADALFKRGSVTLSGGVVELADGSLLEAPGADVSLQALQASDVSGANGSRIYIDHGATIDVSGLANVSLPMSALFVTVPRVGQNELADSPLLRNSFLYTQKDVTLDSTQSGTRADGLDWVGSPIINAAGYVQNMPRDISQMLTGGGNVTLNGNQVIVRSGSSINLDGGYLAYQAGWITTPNLLGADGLLHDITSADPNVAYVGFAGQFTQDHARWGVSETFNSPLLGGQRRWADSFIVGSDAGKLNIQANEALVLDGDISAQAYAGTRQTEAGTQPLGGTLEIGQNPGMAPRKPYGGGIRIQQSSLMLDATAPGFTVESDWGDAWKAYDTTDTSTDNPLYWAVVSTDMLDRGGFSNVSLTGTAINETAGTHLAVKPGGSVSLTGSRLDIYGEISAPAGSITLTATGPANPLGSTGGASENVMSYLTVHDGATLSARGQWVNDTGAGPGQLVGSRYINGGSVNLASQRAYLGASVNRVDGTASIDLEAGSLVDVSGGGYVGTDGRVRVANGQPVGRGGDVSIATYTADPNDQYSQTTAAPGAPRVLSGGNIAMDGDILGYGFSGGGTFALQARSIVIGDESTTGDDGALLLDPAFFRGQGFDRYSLQAVTDATVLPGTSITVERRNLVSDLDQLRQLGTGGDIYGSGQLTFLDPYTRWATRDPRDGHGPGFALGAGTYLGWFDHFDAQAGNVGVAYAGKTGSVLIGDDASVGVDAGGDIALHSQSNVRVHGSLTAPGGSIDISLDRPNSALAPRSGVPRVWIGSDGLLDASGMSLINPFATPVSTWAGGLPARIVPRTGTVLAGGTISLAADTGYLVAEKGATFDVSGAADTFELPVASLGLNGTNTSFVAAPVWSDAGSIHLTAAAGLMSDATLRAHAGAPGAEGGSLQINGDTVNIPKYPVPGMVLVTQSGDTVPDGASETGAIEAGVPSGILHFVADSLTGSGITSLTLGDSGSLPGNMLPIEFAGDVDLHLDRSISLAAPSLIALPAGSVANSASAYLGGEGHVRISAPYISLLGGQATATAPVAQAGDGTLEFDATTMDMGGSLNLQRWIDARFLTTGDTRFIAPLAFAYDGAGAPVTGLLYSTGNLTFQAAQIYPGTDYRFVIAANGAGIVDGSGSARETTVTILPNGAATAPLSAGGALLVDADHIEQEGTIRVPSGQLVLGVSDAARDAADFGIDPLKFPLKATQTVHLAPGSVTSVSLDGLTVPYGTTVDGTGWRYNGSSSVASDDLDAPPSKQVAIHGDALALDDGATIDLSGGGSLQAAEWVPGTGGTRDVLAQRATVVGSGTATGAPQYADGRNVYAILPGKQSPVAAYDPAFAAQGGTGPAAGQQVYLSGIPGLAAGYYTLLPARYATLPGAFRVVQDTSAVDSVLGRAARQADGTWAVTGYFGDALTGAHDARHTTFLLQSGDVWKQYSQYTLSDADSFFGAKAASDGVVAPRLAADAGRLMLDAGSRLDLGTTLSADPAKNGRSSQVDIAADAIQVVGADAQAREGYLTISADGLTKLGAGSLLLGGTRRTTDEGDLIDGDADSVVIANDAAHPLAGQEILLVARASDDPTAEGVHLTAGSVVQATGAANPVGSQPLVFGSDPGTDARGNATAAVSGDGSMLRVSQNGTAVVIRHQVPGVDGIAGTSKGKLGIDAGALADGGSALTLDATGSMRVDENAVLAGTAIDANANRIAFVGDGVDGGSDGLVIGARTLDLFRGAQDVTLRSRGDIDFLGDIDISLDNKLTLNANALVGDGGNVSIKARQFGLGNTMGAGTAATPVAGAGELTLQAGEIDFGPGDTVVSGFSHVAANASSGMAGQGSGGVDFGSIDVDLSAPIFLADGGADTALTTTGALRLAAAAGTAIGRDAMGGGITLTGASIDTSMSMRANAGSLHLTATTGAVNVAGGTSLDVSGVDKTFFDTTASAPGGSLALTATHSDVNIASGALLAFGGGDRGGDAGQLTLAAGGAVQLAGTLDGHAAQGYRGGYFTYSTGSSVDLGSLAGLAANAGATGLLDITSGQGDLALGAGQTITANKVYLYANGGTTRIDGTIDASSPAGSHIELYGRRGVDVEGHLIATSSIDEQRGGDVIIGTTGTPDANGALDATYGYEVVHRSDAGVIHVGPNATIDVSGGSDSASAGGRISFRAPLLDDGDVPVTIDNPSGLTGARDVTIEPYAVWSTADRSSNEARHFDGIIDPAGWYTRDASGKPVLVAGTWTDASGNLLAAPTTDDELQQYLSENYFVPTTANADHTGFYGYAGADAASGPGTLMGFIQSPGFTFGDRFAGIRNVNVRPGIELDNPADATGVDSGAIRILTNWNLGAGTTAPDGSISLAYRYGAEAPILTMRAGGDVDIQASISDGFYQQNNGATLSDPPVPPPPVDDNGYADALAAYQAVDTYITAKGDAWNNGTINLKTGTTADTTVGGGTMDISKDPSWTPILAPLTGQSKNYYANYEAYITEVGTDNVSNRNWLFNFVAANTGVTRKFLRYAPTTLTDAPKPASFTAYGDYVAAYTAWLKLNFKNTSATTRNTTPTPILTPVDPDYTDYTSDYTAYIGGHSTYWKYVAGSVGTSLTGSQLFYAPFAPRGDDAVHNFAYDNALAAYRASLAYLDSKSAWDNGTINLKAGTTADTTVNGGTADITKDPNYVPLQAPLKGQSNDYYTNYSSYITEVGTDDVSNRAWAYNFVAANSGVTRKFLRYMPTTLIAPLPGDYGDYDDYVTAYVAWLKLNFKNTSAATRNTTPTPLLTPIDPDYVDYTADYAAYIAGHSTYWKYVAGTVGNSLTGSQLFYAPFAPRDDVAKGDPTGPVTIPDAAPNNSPSNMPSLGNATSFASATLLGGDSSSFRFVAGADMDATSPLAVRSGTDANVSFDGHFAVTDTLTDPTVVDPRSPFAGKTLLFPTTVRTGTGSIDVVSSGDLRWLDASAPATIYTAGRPADGTTADTSVSVVRPATMAGANALAMALPDYLVTGVVNPEDAGDLNLQAGGDILGIQRVVDTDGSITRVKGTDISQYWWQWMQVGNPADRSRSSIDFGNFAQGIMSAGGNVSVEAGGDVSQLSVSLPTTWVANADHTAVTTIGGGNLDVHAGGDILSGTYFVGKGLADINAGGAIASAPGLASLVLNKIPTPVSTLVALQDAQVDIQARQGVDLGGIYDPSLYNGSIFTFLLPSRQVDGQGYTARSSVAVQSVGGDVTLGSLRTPGTLFGAAGVVGPYLPATLAMTALGGDLNILTDGALAPSPDGNLSLLAGGSVAFSRQTSGDSQGHVFGLLDSESQLYTPFNQPGQLFNLTENLSQDASHDATPLHGNDAEPVRIYALGGDVIDGIDAPNGFNYLNLIIMPAKQAMIYAGRDIVNLAFIGQQSRAADITRIAAGRDIYDTAFLGSGGAFVSYIANGYSEAPRLLLGGPGSFLVEAGRNIGPLTNQLELPTSGTRPTVGIQSVGNLYNTYLPHDGADVNVAFGVGPGVDTAGFLAKYLDTPDLVDGVGSLVPDLVAFMNQRVAGEVVDTGFAKDKLDVSLTPDQAMALFGQEPEYVQRLFAERALFKILGKVGTDYNDASSPFHGQYARGYAAIDALFPASSGYTGNGAGNGGLNGAAATVNTGNLDIRSTTIQTQQGGDVTIVGPGGQALVGSTSAPSQIVDTQGNVVAGPNTMGVLTLERGDVNMFTDRSVLLAQSRIFTEQGGDVTIWSSNGDINAGQGAKTTAEVPPLTFICSVDAWCRIDARGQVSGAGIATLQSTPDAPEGNARLIAPRGTVDAGDAGIRVSGNLVIAAARVANADNIQVKGDAVGIPVTAAVNVGALNAASAAATAASQAAEDVARKQQSDARDRVPSIISVNVLRDGNNGASIDSGSKGASPVSVLGSGRLDEASASRLTPEERRNMR